jgi:hypothetical protein
MLALGQGQGQRKRRHEASDLSAKMEDGTRSALAKWHTSLHPPRLIFYSGTASHVAPHSSTPRPIGPRHQAHPARHVAPRSLPTHPSHSLSSLLPPPPTPSPRLTPPRSPSRLPSCPHTLIPCLPPPSRHNFLLRALSLACPLSRSRSCRLCIGGEVGRRMR